MTIVGRGPGPIHRSRVPDVLLAHAYFLAEDPREQEIMRPFPPLGLQYLVAYLRQRGHDAGWWDSTFAPSRGDFAAAVAEARPRLCGFYGHTITRPVTAELVRVALDAGARVIAGGPDPVQYLDAYFDMGVEVVVIGEGEGTTEALVRHLRARAWSWDFDALGDIDGIAFRVDGQVRRTSPRARVRDLDSLPWPARERADHAAYLDAWRRRHGETAMSLATSRGCPYHCTWCSKQVYGDSFRRRSVDAVIDEMEFLRDTYAPDQLWFVDDLFTINRRWVGRFARRVQERAVGVPFYAIGRAETLDEETCENLRLAGCRRLFMSAESGADHVLDAMRKGTTVADLDRATALLRAAGIEIGAFVMLGYPGETKPDILLTRDLLRRMDPEVTLLSIAHPMKGTQFYDEVQGRLSGEIAGRLVFQMTYTPELYEVAKRLMFADRDLRHALRAAREAVAAGNPRAAAGHARAAAVAALRYPAWRAAFAALDG